MKSAIKKLLRQNKYVEMLAYVLQNNQMLNTSGSGEFGNTIEEMHGHGKNVGDLYINNYKGSLEGKSVLEIGTGFTRTTILHMIKTANISKGYCYDRFNCLHENDDKIIKKFDLYPHLEKLYYLSGKNEELLKIEKKSIDYIVSNAVLEHVDNLNLLFSTLSQLLKDDGVMYHKVDLRCHNRFKKHGELYFHTFSDKAWNMMGGNIGQPNRVLLKEYITLFEKYNLKYELNILENFSTVELEKAHRYLPSVELKEYEVSIVEFKVYKKVLELD